MEMCRFAPSNAGDFHIGPGVSEASKLRNNAPRTREQEDCQKLVPSFFRVESIIFLKCPKTLLLYSKLRKNQKDLSTTLDF